MTARCRFVLALFVFALIVLGLTLGGGTLMAAQTAPAAPDKMVQEKLGYAANARLLVIHADDFGMSHSVNRATMEALEKGWITSASILVPCPWFPEVARWAKQHPEADLGVHLALNSEWTDFRWGPVSGPSRVPSLLDDHGYLPLESPAVLQNARIPDVETELWAQIERAQAAGIQLSHLDTHMGTLVQKDPLRELYRQLGTQFHLPILLARSGSHGLPAGEPQSGPDVLVDKVLEMEPGTDSKDWLDWYKKELTPLPAGVYQLIVHLAYDDEEMRGATWDHPDWGAAWRQHDFDMVRSAKFRQFLKDQGFVLVTWKELGKAR